MNAQKIMDEIDVFLSKSLLKKSKITKAQIVDFIETKWVEADEEKYKIYNAYIYAHRMINEYEELKDCTNVLRWIDEMYKCGKAKDRPSYVKDYYRGERCLACGQKESALKYLQKSYDADRDYVFAGDERIAKFFKDYLANPEILPEFIEEEYDEDEFDDFGFEIELEHFGKILEQERKFYCTFLNKKGDEVYKPSRTHSNAVDFLRQNQEEILNEILTEIFKNYPKWQENYDYPIETKNDFMPNICAPQELGRLLELQNIYILLSGKTAKIGFEFSCSWDMEHGLGVMTQNGKVLKIGSGETAFGF